MSAKVLRRSYLRSGRLLLGRPKGLKAGAVRLTPGQVMDWHSTRAREEVLIALAGTVSVEVRRPARRLHRMTLRHGEYAFLPQQTVHRVVNRQVEIARYLYVTAPIR